MARRKKKSKSTRQETSHRKAPRPSTWNCSRGWCRFCGEKIIEDGKQNRRKHWHQPCADRWKIMNDPKLARHHVFIREKGTCQGEGCGFRSPLMKDFQVDHVRPLFEAQGDLSYYGDENMQLLCISCHLKKTKEDMARFRESGG